jgi:methylenetetrahydrofolate dehydrogenase (NADP+) / methenyltetrahydrofolate cyclohydrolase
MNNIIDGKKISAEIKQEIKLKVEEIIAHGGKRPHLSAVLVGNDGGSESYVNFKMKDCEEVGFESSLHRFDENIAETELLNLINKLNNDNNVDGFIVQLPLPKHIDENRIIEAISPEKDVDGFHPVNVGRMVIGLDSFVSATPMGIVELLKRYKIEASGKNCVIIGRSNIVGRPLSILMSQKDMNATVTVVHSRTKNINEICRNADIIIAAMGQPDFVKADMVKDGAVVIDVGTTRVKSDKTKSGFRLAGDVDYQNVAPKCSYITPVPGGVGPMTRTALLMNTLKAAAK